MENIAAMLDKTYFRIELVMGTEPNSCTGKVKRDSILVSQELHGEKFLKMKEELLKLKELVYLVTPEQRRMKIVNGRLLV